MHTLALLTWTAFAAPVLKDHAQDGVTLSTPVEWKVLIKGDEHSAVISQDASTHIHLHWWPYKEGASPDKMLDKLITVTASSIPLGQIKETSRSTTHDGRGRLVTADFGTLGYTMKLGFMVVMDPVGDAIKGAILLTTPAGWTDLGATTLLTTVTDSLKVPPTKK